MCARKPAEPALPWRLSKPCCDMPPTMSCRSICGVAVGNTPAIRLYQKAGFEIYGTEPRALFVNGRYIDEHMMVRFLDKAPGKQTDR